MSSEEERGADEGPPRRRELRGQDNEKDIAFFRRSYARADLHADIAGFDAEAGARRIEELFLARDCLPTVPQAQGRRSQDVKS